MKKSIKTICSGITAGALVLFAGCDLLQSGLSSEMKKQLEMETGSAKLIQKNWYYNGIAGDDVSNEFYTQSLKVSFGKKVAIGESGLNGSLTVTYVDSDGNQSTKSFTGITGEFSSDCTSFYIDMDSVLSLFDGQIIPSGEASVEVKATGFICAEGNQSGRSIGALNQKIAVKPLFQTKEMDFSTCWYEHGKSNVSMTLNCPVNISNNQCSIKGSDGNDYSFEMGVNGNEIIITPKVDVKNIDGVYVELPLQNILPEVCGNSFNSNIKINLVKNAIVIDGKKDDNYSSVNALNISDEQNDQVAFGQSDWAASMPDIQDLTIVNDGEYLYLAVQGNLLVNWNDGLILMINKDGSNDDATSSNYKAADTTSYWHGRPNIYIYHQPGIDDSGVGNLGAYAGASKIDISANVKVSPKGWTTKTNGTFIEYAIPLNQAGLTAGDKIKIIGAITLVWNEGRAVCDVIPNNAVRKENETRTDVQFTFDNAIDYVIK